MRPCSACARTPTCTAATCFRGQRLRTVHVRDPTSVFSPLAFSGGHVTGRSAQRPGRRSPHRGRGPARVSPRRCLFPKTPFFPPAGSPAVGCKPVPHTEGKDGLKGEAGRSSSAVAGFLIEEFTRLVLAGSVSSLKRGLKARGLSHYTHQMVSITLLSPGFILKQLQLREHWTKKTSQGQGKGVRSLPI